MRLKGVVRVAAFILAALVFGSAVSAQTTGTIRGTVKDPSGAVVPGAEITVTLLGTDTNRTVPTDKDGDYEIAELAVGHYSLAIDAPGFKKFIVKDVEVTIGHVIVVNAALEVGASAQTVTVEAAAAQVETTSTQLGAVMNDTAISQLPLNTRDTYQLLQLQPGVQSQLGSNLFYGSDRPGVVSVNGGRGRSNNYMVNGGDANDAFVNLPAVQPSPDAIEEFRVITNTFDAEYGRNSGAVVNVVTKSGTNDWHGDAFEFFRNKVLNARGFFDSVKPDSKQNQFGGTIGGPLWKDHTFFFTSYEGRRIRKGISSDVVTAPTGAERNGMFPFDPTNPTNPIPAFQGTLTSSTVASLLANRTDSKGNNCNTDTMAANGGIAIAAGMSYATLFPNNVIPKSCFDPVALDLFNQFVAPFDPKGTGTIQTVPTGSDRGDQGTIRVDHKISERQQFSAYYYIDDLDQFQPFSNFQAAGANVPSFGDFNTTRAQQVNLSHTWTLGASAVNEFRFSYFREGQAKLNHPQKTNLVQNSCSAAVAKFCFTGTPDASIPGITPDPMLGITPVLGASHEGVPMVTVGGGFVYGNNFEGELPQVGNSFQWSDNFSKIVGKHSLKFGGDVRRVRFDQMLFFEVNGNFTFSTGGPNDPSLCLSFDPVANMCRSGQNDLFPAYFLGLPTSYGQGSAQGENVRNTALYLFAQDSWKLKPNLTLNYGLRWELDTPLYDLRNRVQTFRPGQADTVFPCVISASGSASTGYPVGSPCGPGTPQESIFPLGLVVPGDQGVPRGLTQTYYKAFAPRIGLAYSPDFKEGFLAKLFGESGKSSIRMGYGVFYNPVEQLVLEQFSAEPPFGGSSTLSNTLFNVPFVSQSGGITPNPFNGVLTPKPGSAVDFSVFRPIVLFGEAQPKLRTQYAEQYNFTIQRELKGNVLLQIGYVGSQGHRLLASHDINHGNPQTCLDLLALTNANPNNVLSAPGGTPITCAAFGEDAEYFIPPNTVIPPQGLHLPYGPTPFIPGGQTSGPNGITLVGLRQFSSPFCNPTTGANCPPDGIPVLAPTFAEDTIGNSNYNSLQAMGEKRFSHGLQFQFAYTWSKSIDNASSFEEILNPFNYRLSRSLSLFDARHRVVFSYYWELPIPKHQGFMGKLVNGWATSGIITYQTGFPIRLGISSSSSLTTNDQEFLDGSGFAFETAGEPNIVAPFKRLDPRKSPNHLFFDPTIFPTQNFGTIGNAPRAICCGPTISQTDMAIMKSTSITERMRMEFRAEFFNAWNHTEFLSPDGNPADGGDFGRVKHARDPREIQFGLKLLF